MGKSREIERLKDSQISQVISLAEFLSKYFQNLSGIFDVLAASLSELKASRLAIKRGAAPLSISELSSIAESTDAKLAHILQRSEVLKYELGRLNLRAENSFDFAQIKLYQDLLKRSLKKAYGVDFMIKVK